MRSSTRYGLVGIAALALLSSVHWLRDQALAPNTEGDYLLGILPNFAAAIAITFVLLSIWSDQRREARFAEQKRAFIACALTSGLGLLAWEYFQMSSDRFVFDLHDIGATLIGIAFAGFAFSALAPRAEET